MRGLRVGLLGLAVSAWAGTAWAQLGLYGAPEVLNLSVLEAPGPYGGMSRYAPGPVEMVPARVHPRYAQPTPPPPPELRPNAALSEASAQAPAKSQSPKRVDQMLARPVWGCYDGGCGEEPTCDEGCFRGGLAAYARAACDDDRCCPWYASTSALVMGRDRANHAWTTYRTDSEPDQLMHTNDADTDWRWGGEVTLGRRFCCGAWSVEGTYWTLDPLEGYASMTDPAGVSTTLTVGQLYFDGTQATAWFDRALEHRIRRDDEIHNVEVNLVRNRFYGNGPWSLDWLVGLRYFRFQEGLTFSTLADSANLPLGETRTEAYLEDEISNDLLGVQFGFNAEYWWRPRWRFFCKPRFGIYNNSIDHDFRAALTDGTVATQAEYPGLTYPVQSSKDVVSFMTQLDLGLDWQFARGWSAQMGYRLLVATGIGLADHQIPHFIVDIPEIADIEHNGDLILHGAFVGLTYNF